LWIPACFALVGLGILSVILVDQRAEMFIVACAACALAAVAYLAVSRLMPGYDTPRLLIGSYGLQLCVLAAIAALGLPLGPPYHPFEVSAGDAPIRAVLAMLTVPAAVLLVSLAWWSTHRSLNTAAPTGAVDDIARRRRPYLVLAALLQLLYWFGTLEDSGAAGYAVRVVATALMAAPFLAGRDSVASPGLAALWIPILLVNAVVGVAAGTRSQALIPVVLFTVGCVSALPARRRLALGTLALAGTIPLIQFAGAVGVVRDDLGRGGLELLKPDHVREVFRHLSAALTPGGNQDAQEVNVQGLSRMLAWANVVVPVMTPEVIPYRGLDGFFTDAVQTFRIARVSDLTADDLYDAGLHNAQARAYGFTVTSSTSVEFGLAPDAWSKGGAPLALLFAVVATFALMAAERAAHRIDRHGLGVGSILALPVAKAAFFDGTVVPLLFMLRGIVLYMLVVGTLVLVVEAGRRLLPDVRPRRGVRVRPSMGHSGGSD